MLKNYGYHLEHNFDHGSKYLSMILVLLNLLAFSFTRCWTSLMRSLHSLRVRRPFSPTYRAVHVFAKLGSATQLYVRATGTRPANDAPQTQVLAGAHFPSDFAGRRFTPTEQTNRAVTHPVKRQSTLTLPQTPRDRSRFCAWTPDSHLDLGSPSLSCLNLLCHPDQPLLNLELPSNKRVMASCSQFPRGSDVRFLTAPGNDGF